jgi:hypothetical protein
VHSTTILVFSHTSRQLKKSDQILWSGIAIRSDDIKYASQLIDDTNTSEGENGHDKAW